MLRVLVIDDSQDDFILACDLLQRQGLKAKLRLVANKAELTEALGEKWDLCLIDWVVPEMTTPEAIRILRDSRQPDLPLIVWSGRDDDKVAYIATDVLGAKAFLPKSRYEELPGLIVRIIRE